MAGMRKYREVLGGTARAAKVEAAAWNQYPHHQLPEFSPSEQPALEGAQSRGLMYGSSRIAKMDATFRHDRIEGRDMSSDSAAATLVWAFVLAVDQDAEVVKEGKCRYSLVFERFISISRSSAKKASISRRSIDRLRAMMLIWGRRERRGRPQHG